MPAATSERHVNVATLRESRSLQAHRCTECHTLPPLWHYAVEDRPEYCQWHVASREFKTRRARRDRRTHFRGSIAEVSADDKIEKFAAARFDVVESRQRMK
jgi:hypothetical protein